MLHRKRAIGDGRPFLWKNLILSVVLWYCDILTFTLSGREKGTRNEKKRDVFRDADVVF